MRRRIAAAIVLVAVAVAGWWMVRDAWWLEGDHYGALTVAEGVPTEISLGDGYRARLDAHSAGPRVVIEHVDDGGRALWSSVPGRAFVAAARGRATLEEARGMASVDDDIEGRCVDARLEAMIPASDDGPAAIEGTLDCAGTPWPWRWVLVPQSASRIRFDLELAPGGDLAPNRVLLVAGSHIDEGFYGFGEQFSVFDLKGRDLPIVVSEQGIGRGVQPLTIGADLTADGAGGHWHSTYVAMPYYLTSDLRGFALDGGTISRFDLRRPDAAVVSLLSPHMQGYILRGDAPLALVEAWGEINGRMRALPDWIHRGAVVGMQGGTARVREVWGRLKASGAPIAAFWLQDWVGQRKTSFGKQLWWSWTLDERHYPGWDALVAEMASDDIRVMTYVNPFLVDAAERGEGRDLYREAREAGYLALTPDGAPYQIRNTSFSAGLLDVTHPGARDWFVGVLRDEVMARGASGWMADFGEGLPFDAVLHDGDAREVHNRYPTLWAELNRRAIDEAGQGTDAVFFTRSGYLGTPRHSTLFWLGDQLVEWDRHDGIKSAVIGLLSGGVSGVSLNHSDIGGYTTIDHPLRDHHRSAALHRRWAELAAFTVVYRTHEGNRPDQNAQFHDDGVIEHFARMARLHGCWFEARRDLIAEAAERGWPVVRHMWLHYPDHAMLRRVTYEQFMVGRDLIVAPALDPDIERVEVLLPDDGWVHIWSGRTYGAGTHEVAAPVGEPAALARAGSPMDAQFAACPVVAENRPAR